MSNANESYDATKINCLMFEARVDCLKNEETLLQVEGEC